MIVLAYWMSLLAVACGIVLRGVTPARFLLWSGLCDLTGFLIVAALMGWGVPYARQRGGVERNHRSSPHWFAAAQAALFACCAALAAWVSLDFAFDGIGEGVALLGLAGRRAGCPASLMLLGAAVLMAWQTAGPVRAGWQYAALVAGVLFTSSLGWSGIDASTAGRTAAGAWLARGETLLISASMMTVMTGYGLARFLPADTDWIPRARRAMPVFAGVALLMLVLVLALTAGCVRA